MTILMGFFCFNAFAQVSPGVNNHSFQYLTGVLTPTSTVTNIAPAWNAEAPPKYYTMAITATTASAFQIRLEGSVDQLSWQTLSNASAIGTASVTTPTPSLYFRMRATLIPANTSITGTAIGVW